MAFGRKKERPPGYSEGIAHATVRQAKTTIDFISGFSLARQWLRVIKQSNQRAWHTDDAAVYWTASMPEDRRRTLANKVMLESVLYFFMGALLFVGGVWHAANASQATTWVVWITLSIFAGVVTMFVSTIKAWQASNIRAGRAKPFLEWFFGKGD